MFRRTKRKIFCPFFFFFSGIDTCTMKPKRRLEKRGQARLEIFECKADKFRLNPVACRNPMEDF